MTDTHWAATAGAVVGAVIGGLGVATCQKYTSSTQKPSTPAKRFKWTTGEKGKSPKERCQLFKAFVQQLQDDITTTLGELDGAAVFEEDAFVKENGKGSGRTRVIRNGNIFESGGCNWSEVFGDTLPPSILGKHPHLRGKRFYATGVSMVLHPRNPHCPTVHLNYRYFEAGDLDSDALEQDNVWWFGGGMDLTPWILYEEDAISFHQQVKAACDKFGPQFYPSMKRYADDYFLNKHRDEGRGIGGHFFDYLNGNPEALLYQGENAKEIEIQKKRGFYCPKMTWTDCLAFAQEQGAAFLPAYTAILKKRRNTPETEEQRTWQLYRRGRYVEFNLVHDRGTLFGLQMKGRTESILMSLPPLVKWGYMVMPKTDSEKKLVDVLQHPRDWLDIEKHYE